ncbi:MAG TPA: tetratricopeptide repeat protein [Blastocatellia bacterium]|jgi:tetratricopeptide (TPR) repeat protein|nr:tetratricopeptide repeat protein [Blastocatellia bacterium]
MSGLFSEQFFIRSVCLLLMTGACAECFAQASTTTPATPESARALYQGDPRRAAELAEKRLRQYPNDATERVIRARAELAQGNFERAYQELQTALASDPRNIDALYYLAIVAKTLSQQEYQRLYALAPDSARVHMLMAEAALAQENPTEAEAEFQAALKASPGSIEVLTALGELKRSQSNFDEAIAYYAQAEGIGPLNYTIAYGLGACYTYKQESARAIEYLRKATAFAPNSAAGRFALGNALYQGGQTEAAIPELKAALELEPRLKQAYFLLGRAYQKLGRQAEAKVVFSNLDELNRNEAAGQGKTQPRAATRKQTGSKQAPIRPAAVTRHRATKQKP